MYREKIDAYIDSKKEEMLQDLSDLMRIDSQRGEAKPGMPYGEGPAKVLDEAGKLMDRLGLSVKNYDNYVVVGDYGEGEKVLDILAHLDVVPVSDQWTVTDPFEPKVVGDRIYGRGSSDDKGPAIAALYAVKAIKDLGIPLSKSLRIILGADEECGSSDLEYYYGKEEEALYTFTPDADFPLINMEKGRLGQSFGARFEKSEGACLVRLEAGDKVNIVPSRAKALVRGLDFEEVSSAAKSVQEDTGVTFTVRAISEDAQEMAEGRKGDIYILAQGVAAHASLPADGNNAITALLSLLDRLPLAKSDSARAVHALCELFPHGDTQGKAFGIAMEDEVSGALTLNLGVLNFDEEGFEGQFDIRSPLCGTDENVTFVMDKCFKDRGITMEEGTISPVHYVPADSPLVTTLLKSYEKYFGKKGKPLCIGGGTYVHHLKRGVAFGCQVPEVDNHMHGDDEFMEISMLLRSAKIFADAIIALCG